MIAVVEPPKQPQAPTTPDRITELQQTVSASRLILWQQCRLKFFFRYVLRIKKNPTPALHVGKVVHSVLRSWNMARWRKQAFQIQLFKALFEKHWLEEQKEKRINWKDE